MLGHSLGGPAHVDAGRRRVRPLGDGEVHPDPPPVDLLVVHAVAGNLGILHGLEVDEGKAAGATGLTQTET